MRFFKFGILIVLFLAAVYAVSMTFVDESKNFTIEKEINYPVDKVFPQFNNLQNFVRWNAFFSDNPNLSFQFFTPYEGKGSSMTYRDRKSSGTFGDVFIRYENPNRTLRYQLFEGKENSPYLIDIKFRGDGNKTKLTWYIHTPKQPLLKRSLNLISEDYIADNIAKSMLNLATLMGGKVDKETQLASIKYDSIMVENQEGRLLLGINVSSSNKKGALFKNIVINHNKVINFVSKDLGKKDDEFGEPVLLTEAGSYKNKEVSYFYGVPLSKRVGITDNNFSFRTINPSQNYVIYFKGNYDAREKAITALLQKAKKDSMRNGTLEEMFVNPPSEGEPSILKLSLPVYR